MQTYIEDLRERREISFGTEKDAIWQHRKGRLTARERLEMLTYGNSPGSTRS